MKDDRILHAFGTTWDAADAVACRMRLQAIHDMTGRPDVEVDASSLERARMALRTPSGNPTSCRMSEDGTTMLAICAVPSDQGHGSLAMALIGHPVIGDFVLDMPLGSTDAVVRVPSRSLDPTSSRVEAVLQAVKTTSARLESGRREEALRHRRELRIIGKSVETVVARHWTDQGSLTGALASIMATIECPTPWTDTTFTTRQAIGGNGDLGVAMNWNRRTGEPRPLLDEEGLAILAKALPLAVEIAWDPETKTPDGTVERRMTIRPASWTTMISKRSLGDAMETLRCHRAVPIPERCLKRIC